MILPTKHLPLDRSLLGIGAQLLALLDEPKTISGLWAEVQANRGEKARHFTFDWFILALNLLHSIDAIKLNRGRVIRGRTND
jgi:hypothetical protein